MKKVTRKQAFYVFFGLSLILAGILYSSTLSYPFVWDDIKVVQDNVLLRTRHPPTLFFQPHFWKYMVPISRVDYRPLQMLALKAISLWGGRTPLPFRLTNILVHLLVCVMIWLLVTSFASKIRSAFWAAVFFAFHPVHVEAVINARNISELLAVAFMLGAFLIFIRCSRWTATPAAGLLFLLALLCKENALILPFLMVAYAVIWKDGKRRSASLLRTLPFWCVAAAGFVWKLILLSGEGTGQRLPAAIHYVLGAARLTTIYLRLLIFPFKLTVLYPVARPISWAQPQWFFPLLLIFTLVLTGGFFRRGNRFFFWAFLSLGISLLPTLAKIGQIGRMVAEQRVYFPSIFSCLLTAFFVDRLANRLHNSFSRFATLSAIFLCFFYAGLTREYLNSWKDTFTLWSRVTKRSPDSALGHNNLAVALHQQGKDEEALQEWKEAVRLQPDHKEAHNNLGVFYRRRGWWEKAASEFEKSLESSPSYHPASLNLAEVCLNLRQLKRAEKIIRKVLDDNPYLAEAYNELAIVLEQEGEYTGARAAYLKAAELNPEDAVPLRNLVRLLQESGDTDGAIAIGRRAIKSEPDNPAGYLTLARVYIALGGFSKARALLKNALELAPDSWEIKSQLWSLESCRSSSD